MNDFVTEGATLEQLIGEIERMQTRLDELTNAITTKYFPETQMPERPSVAVVRKKVCQQFNLRASTLMSRSREMHIAWPRQIAMCLSYQLCGISTTKVAKLFNRGDHGTVLHAVHAVQNRCDVDRSARTIVNELRRVIAEEMGR